MKKKNIRILSLFCFLLSILLAYITCAQSPNKEKKPAVPMRSFIKPYPGVQQRSYHFNDTDEDLSYVLYVSSKVSKDRKNPLIVALHGGGGDGNFIVRDRLVDMAEENGYIVVGPMGYNVGSWFGIPMQFLRLLRRPPINPPPNLAELSEKDVMNVVDMMQKEFNVDENRIYIMGHSMGGSGALYLGQRYLGKWAAIACIAPVTYMIMKEGKNILSPVHDSGIPVMIIQGDKDRAVEVEYTRQWIDIMKGLNMKYEYIEFPGGDHGTVKNDGMPDMYRFFAEHTKENRKKK